MLFHKEAIDRLRGDMARLRSEFDAGLRGLDAKIGRPKPEGDIKAIHRALKTKAPLDETTATLSMHDRRMKNVDSVLKQMNEEMESFARALRNTQDFIDALSFNKSQIIAGTKGMNCLVCGRNELGTVVLNTPNKRRKS